MEQPPVEVLIKEKRIKNFKEVSLGYIKKVAVEEARRCPQCSDPICIPGCPLNIDIPEFIRLLREGNISGALDKIREQNYLPAICGRICPAPCETACILTQMDSAPIGIKVLERYAADHEKKKFSFKSPVTRKGKKVAVIGSGPMGLTAAAFLAKKDYQVTVFESMDKPGGALRYGIPEFRIPSGVLDSEINEIKALGVDIKTNFFLGRTATIDELKEEGFKAVFLATGLSVEKSPEIPGHSLSGVFFGIEFLMRFNFSKSDQLDKNSFLSHLGKKMVIVGSNDIALDCARIGVRLGKDVTVIIEKSEDELQVNAFDTQQAKEEGVKFEALSRPLEIISDEKSVVSGIKCIRMDYADPQETGTWQLIPVEDSEFVVEGDLVVVAGKNKPNNTLSKLSADLKVNSEGEIKVDGQTGMTSIDGVFANLSTTENPSVVEAIANGKKAVENIHTYLRGRGVSDLSSRGTK